MRTSNPALSDGVFQTARRDSDPSAVAVPGVMTIRGTVAKTAVLVLILVGAGVFGWTRYAAVAGGASADGSVWVLALVGAALAAFAVAMVTCFVPRFAPVTAPVYALLEGFVLGLLSALMEAEYPGIVASAAGLTVGTLAALLGVYSTGLIKVTDNFRLMVVSATGAIALVYLATMLLGLFGVRVPYIHDSGPVGIIFSLFVVAVAALNLVLDFDFIERGAKSGAPRYMEWYAGFGLLVTLVWLYLEILRLLAKLRDRR